MTEPSSDPTANMFSGDVVSPALAGDWGGRAFTALMAPVWSFREHALTVFIWVGDLLTVGLDELILIVLSVLETKRVTHILRSSCT